MQESEHPNEIIQDNTKKGIIPDHVIMKFNQLTSSAKVVMIEMRIVFVDYGDVQLRTFRR